MEIDTRLTILLTLKGRHPFTFRWLWHANQTRLPFRVFIADGDPDSPVGRWIEAGTSFPHLQINYRKYNDRTYKDFYEKILDATTRIQTPYVMLADNDDFLFPSGIRRALEFLETAPDYVSAGEGIAQFELHANPDATDAISGGIARFWYQQSKPYRAYDVSESSAAGRSVKTYAGQLTVHYNVCRVAALECIARDLARSEFQLLETAELYWKLRLATLGKLRAGASRLFYLRQQGTSSNPQRGVDFIKIVSSGPYVAEIQRALDKIASFAGHADGVAPELVAGELRRIFATHLRQQLSHVLGPRAVTINWVKARIPAGLLQSLRIAYDKFASGERSATGGRSVSRQRVFALMTENGAAPDATAEQARELAEIERTLASDAFRATVEELSPVDAARKMA